jgi:hypothetical protein
MRRTLPLALAALFLAGSISAPALAQNATSQHGANQPAAAMPKSDQTPNTGGVAPDNEKTGSIARDNAMNTLLSAIAQTHSTATAVSAMKQVSGIRVVRIGDIAKGDDARTVANAMKDSSNDRKALQAAVRSNPALSVKLKSKKTSASQVVAAKIEADGTVTFFAN